MKNTTLALGLLLAATGSSAAEIGGQGGSHFWTARINSDRTAPGVQAALEYVHGHQQTHLLDASLGYGFSLGALQVAPRIGAFWADVKTTSTSSRGMNGGIRLMAPLPRAGATWIYLDYSLSPDFANHNLHALHQLEAGVYYQPAKWLSLSSGYRYLSVNGDYGHADQSLMDGLFIGAAVRF